MPELALFQGDTLTDLIVERAREPERIALRFGLDHAHTYADVLASARRAAAVLVRHHVAAGDRVLVMLPTGPEFVAIFFGCQLLGAIPVPVVPPWSRARLDAHLERIARIARIARPMATVTTPAVAALCRTRDDTWLRGAISSDELARETVQFDGSSPGDPDFPAFIQFTSGSTAEPRGAVISQRAVLVNTRGIATAAGFRDDDIMCSWLPLFHDMGLIGHLITPYVCGTESTLLAPEQFAVRPVEWLRVMSRLRATVSTAPNFAYRIAADRIPDRDLRGLDLSAWRVALCGGEPISADTATAFARRFAPHGLSPTAFFPVYGLAEMTLAATFPPPGRATRVDEVDREALERDRVARPATGHPNEQAARIVSCGRPFPGHALQIVDDKGEPLPERRVGEIELRGLSMMSGYFRDPAATLDVMPGGWLRTGDLGYVADGELFVVGRRKEVIIVRGRNLAPYDVEAAAASVDGVRKGRVAAVGVPDAERGTELLVVVCESRARKHLELVAAVRRAVLEHVGVTPDRVIVTRPGVVPKTSSGKIQRRAVRDRVIAGDLDRPAPGLWSRLAMLVRRGRQAPDMPAT